MRTRALVVGLGIAGSSVLCDGSSSGSFRPPV